MITYDDLAERWNIPKSRLYVWKARGKLPAFDIEQGRHPARVVGWHPETIEQMEDANGPFGASD